MARSKKKTKPGLKVLFAASEAYPLIKTGGLADVAHSLPNALAALGLDVRLILPGYREVLQKVEDVQILGWLRLGAFGDVRILQAYHPEFSMALWLVDAASLFDREGNPYTRPDGSDWPDNALRFSVFSRAVALLGVDALHTGWRPDVVHANDWQTGLVPAFLSQEGHAPRRIYTIHNLAYDCQFDYAQFLELKLPPHWWSMEHCEFYGRFSLMKAGLVFGDWINTVSPTYAQEICTDEYGYGYAGILQSYQFKLTGIINGIDVDTWNPQTDPHLAANYSLDESLQPARQANREALLQGMGASAEALAEQAPLIGFVGRLVYQKGIDLLLDAMPMLLESSDARFAIIGSGEHSLEQRLLDMAREHPQRVFAYIGYSEPLAHLLEAGSDMFVMPSRYEPCGLNQLYSLHYGTPPVVRRTGGLADSVVDTNEQTIEDGSASGFVFDEATPQDLASTLQRALQAQRDPALWEQLQRAGMQQDLSWEHSARSYLELYRQTPPIQE